MRLKRSLFGLGLSLALSAQPLQAGEFLGGWIRFPQKPGQECPAEPCLPDPAPAEAPDMPPPDGQAPQVPLPEPFAQPPEAGTSANRSAAPNMLGDQNGGACGTVNYLGALTAEINHPTFSCSRTKIAENNSPIPRDRAYVTYQHFHNVNNLFLDNPDVGRTFQRVTSIDRVTFGLEKTFLGGNVSLELRVPTAFQLRNDMVVNSNIPSITDQSNFNLGNISVVTKVLLFQNECWLVSGGLLVHAPSANDVVIQDVEDDGGDLILNTFVYHNRATILSPFLGALWTPSNRLFVQGFAQLDVDPNGNSVDIQPTLNGVAGAPVNFRFNEQTLLRLDLGAGYWLYRNSECGWYGLTGVAPVIELHYTTTLDNAELATFDRAADNQVILGNIANRLDILNLVVGTTFEWSNRATLAVGAVLPLRDEMDKPFDVEVNVQLNYRFGPCAR